MVCILPDGRVGRAYNFLDALGRPATIEEIMEGIGEPADGWRVFGLRTSINAYAAKGKLFKRLKGGLVQILEGTEVHFGCRPPKEGGATDAMRIRARMRVIRALHQGRGIMTPAGVVFTRPNCQWCYAQPWEGVKWRGRYDRRQSDMEAWHILPYGPAANDLFVIFLCPRCTVLFSDAEPLKLITERFTAQLQKNQRHPQIAAILRGSLP